MELLGRITLQNCGVNIIAIFIIETFNIGGVPNDTGVFITPEEVVDDIEQLSAATCGFA